MKTISLSLAALLIAGAAAPAVADTVGGDDFSFQFTYKRSELATPEGAQRVYTRLHDKVKRRCIGDIRNGYDRAARECVADTMPRVIGQIGSSMLASVYADKMG